MRGAGRIGCRVIAAVSRLPIYAAIVAAGVLVLAVANQSVPTSTTKDTIMTVPITGQTHAETLRAMADEIAGLRIQIKELLDGRACCTPCVAEVAQGQRDAPNIANLINGGVGLCFDHANAVNAAVTGRSAGGILLPGQH